MKRKKDNGIKQFIAILCLGLMALLFLGGYIMEPEEAAVKQEKAIVSVISSIAQDEAGDTKKIALTFDDGPNPYYTEQLLDGLKERKVRATFFLIGMYVEEHPQIVERMAKEGHLIGNHTYSHMRLKEGTEEQYKAELEQTSNVIEEITGKGTEYVRPPFGSWSSGIEKELTMIPVLWNIDPFDWSSEDASAIKRHVVSKARENGIILMHDKSKSSVTAALSIVDELKEQGYEFVTVDELLFD